jgi:zinc transporter
MQPSSQVLSAFVLDGQGGGRAIDAGGTARWKPGEGVLWVVADRTHEGTGVWLRETMGVSEVTCEALLAEDTRPRCLHSQGGLLIILRAVNMNPGAEPDDLVTLRVWLDAEKVICLRGRPVYALQDARERLLRGSGARTPGGVLVQLVDTVTERLQEAVANLEDQVDGIEDLVPVARGVELRSRLAGPRRQVATIRRYLSPQRDMASRLVTEETALFCAQDRLHLREIADEATRMVEELDLLRERAMMIQEQILALASEQMNRTMYTLSLVAAIFLPLTLLTGLLGINVGGVPGSDDPVAFWVVCGVLVLLGVVQWWLFKRRRLL